MSSRRTHRPRRVVAAVALIASGSLLLAPGPAGAHDNRHRHGRDQLRVRLTPEQRACLAGQGVTLPERGGKARIGPHVHGRDLRRIFRALRTCGVLPGSTTTTSTTSTTTTTTTTTTLPPSTTTTTTIPTIIFT